MFNIGGPRTVSHSVSISFGIGSGRHMEGLEAMIIFVNVSRDTGSQNLSVSIDLRSWQLCAESGQVSFEEIAIFKERFVVFIMIMIFLSLLK